MTAKQLRNPCTLPSVLLSRFIREMKMKNTAIEHALHTPIPENMTLQQVGVCNIKIYADYNDYTDHLLVWIKLRRTADYTYSYCLSQEITTSL
jgi:hypothetical protein